MAREYRMGSGAKGALAATATLTLITLAVPDSFGALALLATGVLFAMFAMAEMPLRHSMLGLMFFTLTLPNPAEGLPWKPGWTAPFETAGAMLLSHWNTIDRSVGWLSPAIFSGLDLFFLLLGFLVYQRRMVRGKLDYAGAIPVPALLKRLARISLGTTLVVWMYGMIRGGDFRMSLWQVNAVVYLPVVFLLFSEAIRGPQDFPLILRVLCGAALFRSLFALFVINTFRLPPDDQGNAGPLPYATSHSDSILFADAFLAVVLVFLERVTKAPKWRVLWVLPIFLIGMVSNHRRIVWVHVAVGLAAIFAITADSPLKRQLRRAFYYSIPAICVYVVAGWNAEYGSFFKPIRTLRTVIEADTDRTGSTYWRELENLNLVATLRENPILGTGYGHGFIEVATLPDVVYDLERYCPHNSLLGVWAFAGYLGFLGTTMLWVLGVFYAMRAYRHSKNPLLRSASLTSIACVLVYILHCWGDLGIASWPGVFITGAALAVAGKSWEAASRAELAMAKARARTE